MSIASATTNTETTSKVNPEQAVAFAAPILADDNLTITPEKLEALLKAASITEVEPIWTTLFANALKDKDVEDILTAVATSGPNARGDTAPNLHVDDAQDDGNSTVGGVDIHACTESDEETYGFDMFE